MTLFKGSKVASECSFCGTLLGGSFQDAIPLTVTCKDKKIVLATCDRCRCLYTVTEEES